jgi:primosomal replication protein N|tara:strand:+ start:42 stop:323 length:282 start_codon:yes stop_codon:yes gene_type:complete
LNEYLLFGEIIYLDTKRFTPAGIPVLSLKIRAESEQIEAGLKRIVNVDVESVVIGELANNDFKMGNKFSFFGFFDKRSKKSTHLVFHITQIKN